MPLDDRPDELMIDWGNVPAGTRASIYLPTVDAALALDWAHRMYVSNRLALEDAHTLSCEAGGVTFVPVPGASDVDHVGLMSVELPPSVHKGEHYSVRVRQITGARYGAGRRVEIGEAIRRGRVTKNVAVGAVEPEAMLAATKESSRVGFLYRRTIGAFGLEIPVSTKALMLAEEERTLSILRHIEQTVPVETKWWPVFRRYVDVHVGRVAGMGGDPTLVVATGDGDWKHPDRWHDGGKDGHGHDGHGHDGDDHGQDGDDHGHDDDHHGEHCRCGCRDDDHDRATCACHGGASGSVTGKVVSLRYDHFGDFTGFVVETGHDGHVAVHSTETRIESLGQQAFVTRAVVRVHLLGGGRVASVAISGVVDD